MSGQPTTNSGSSPVSGGGSLSPGGSAGGPGALSPGGTSSTGPTQCCESGRPLVTDPVTGQSVCSCQYDSARLAALQYRNASVGVYGTPYPSTDQNPYPSIGVESSAFYSPLVSIALIFQLSLFKLVVFGFYTCMVLNGLCPVHFKGFLVPADGILICFFFRLLCSRPTWISRRVRLLF